MISGIMVVMKMFQPDNLNRLTRVVSYLLIVYILFLLGRSVWQNYTLKQSIDKLSDQISTLNQEKKNLENLNVYYQSESFKELEARRKLNMKLADEKVFFIASTPTENNFQTELNKDINNVNTVDGTLAGKNWQLWWDFFTKK